MAPVRLRTDTAASDEGHLVQHGGYYTRKKGVEPNDITIEFERSFF